MGDEANDRWRTQEQGRCRQQENSQEESRYHALKQKDYKRTLEVIIGIRYELQKLRADRTQLGVKHGHTDKWTEEDLQQEEEQQKTSPFQAAEFVQNNIGCVQLCLSPAIQPQSAHVITDRASVLLLQDRNGGNQEEQQLSQDALFFESNCWS